MKSRLLLCLVTTIFLLNLSALSFAEDRFNDLLRLVPPNANMIALVDPMAMRSSEIAIREKWNLRNEMMAKERRTMVPPAARRVVHASCLELPGAQSEWDVIAMDIPLEGGLEKLAELEGGNVDTLGGQKTAYSKRGYFISGFGRDLWGAYGSRNRQAAARWIKDSAAASTPQLSNYLAMVVKRSDLAKTPLVLALDLEGVVSAEHARGRLNDDKLAVESTVDLDKLSKLLGSLRGVTMAVDMNDKVNGTLTVDFGTDATIARPIAKEMVLGVMARAGATIDEMTEWAVKVEGTQITLQGQLQRSGIARLRSLFEIPEPANSVAQTGAAGADGAADAPGAKNAAADAADPKAASLRYYTVIRDIVEDLPPPDKVDHLPDAALWMDRYTKKIDKLPILNVDPELLDFGGYVTAQLRKCSMRLKDSSLRVAERNAKQNFYDTANTGGSTVAKVAVPYDTRDYGYYGGYRRDEGYDIEQIDTNVERYRRRYQEGLKKQAATEEKASGRRDAMQIIDEVKTETGRVRMVMTQRYQVEF